MTFIVWVFIIFFDDVVKTFGVLDYGLFLGVAVAIGGVLWLGFWSVGREGAMGDVEGLGVVETAVSEVTIAW